MLDAVEARCRPTSRSSRPRSPTGASPSTRRTKIKKDGDGAADARRSSRIPTSSPTVARRTDGGPPLVVGFAAETENVIANAAGQARAEGLRLDRRQRRRAGTGVMGGDAQHACISSRATASRPGRHDKDEVARRLVARIAAHARSARATVIAVARPAPAARATDLPLPRLRDGGRRRARPAAPPPGRRADRARSPARARWCRPASRSQLPAGLRGPGPAALGARAQARRHGAQRAGHDRRRLSRRGAGDAVNHGSEPFTITRGMRIAQLVVAPVRASRSSRRRRSTRPPRGRRLRLDRALRARHGRLADDPAALAAACSPSRPWSTSPPRAAEPVAAKALAARHNLPPRYLETVLQALVRHGILKGVRGPRGGYELARERRRITAGDIVRAAMTATAEDELPPLPESAARRRRSSRPLVGSATEAFLDDARRGHDRGAVPPAPTSAACSAACRPRRFHHLRS